MNTSHYKNTTGIQKRPKTVWIILIISCWPLISLISYLGVMNGVFPAEGASKDFFDNLNLFDHFIIIFFPLYIFTSALMLFRLKRIAIKLFIGYAVMRVLLTIYYFTKQSYRDIFMLDITDSILSILTSIFIIVFLLYYANKLEKQGILTS